MAGADFHQPPDYTIETKLPVMQGDDPRVAKFNTEVMTLVIQEMKKSTES